VPWTTSLPIRIFHLHASELQPGRLSQEFRRGAAAVVIKGDPAAIRACAT